MRRKREIMEHVGGTRKRLLNAAQRKALSIRVSNHCRKLKWQVEKLVRDEAMPPKVAAAQKIIEEWEAAQKKREEDFDDRAERDEREILQNLHFDSVEECLLQVNDFETCTIESYGFKKK